MQFMSNTSHQDALKAHDAYLDHRNTLQSASLEIAGRFSQWMLTLSGGALGLSITFIEKLKPLILESSRYWLIISWIAFAASLLACLFSLYSSYTATQKAIIHHDDMYQAKRNNPDDLIAEPVNCAGNLTDFLSYASMTLFAVGILALCVFAGSVELNPIKQDGQKNQTAAQTSNNS